jgi:hypothetical protein
MDTSSKLLEIEYRINYKQKVKECPAFVKYANTLLININPQADF